MNIEEVLDDVARHLDYFYATGQFSIRENEMREMLTEISILRMENKKLHSIIKEKDKVITELLKRITILEREAEKYERY